MADEVMIDLSPAQSQSPTITPLRPADEVNELVWQARQTTTLHPTLQALVVKHKELFVDVFGRQVDLIKTRSQVLEEAHVTVYDKVLLMLTDNGKTLLRPDAVTWYCAEYFGFNPHVAEEHNVRAIEQSLALPVALEKESRSVRSPRSTPSPHPPASYTAARRGGSVVLPSIKDDSIFGPLYEKYEKALEDFNGATDEQSAPSADAARWLRDTAENGIQYLERVDYLNQQDQELLEGLKATHVKAQRAVEVFTGGKKRKFDYYRERVENQELNKRHRGSRIDYGPRHHYGRDPVQERMDANAFDSASRSSQSHPYHQPRRYQHANPYNSSYSSLAGRGHGGIPYGYSQTRPVDSYIPDRDHRDRGHGNDRDTNRGDDRDRNWDTQKWHDSRRSDARSSVQGRGQDRGSGSDLKQKGPDRDRP